MKKKNTGSLSLIKQYFAYTCTQHMIKFDDIILFLDTQQDPLIAQSRRGPKCKVYIKKKVCKRIQIKQRNYLPYEKNGLSLIFKTLIGKYRNWHERLLNFVLHFFFLHTCSLCFYVCTPSDLYFS